MLYPDPLLSLPPYLSAQIRKRTDERLSRIISTNYGTQFAQTAFELAEFRDVTSGLVDGMDSNVISELFRKTVHFTTYDSYAPLIARLRQNPCKSSAIANLLAPGLPDYIVISSSTSGAIPKLFPKYNCFPKLAPSDTGSHLITDFRQKRTTAHISHMWWSVISVEDDDNYLIKTMYRTSVSVMNRRIAFGLHPEDDGERMATFILSHAAPYATGFITRYRSFILLHALFAVSSRFLETMTIAYTSMFMDMMHYLDKEFDLIMNCVATGTIPDLDGIAEVRTHLEINIHPDPERATELRNLGPPSSRPGGSFATYLPSTRWHLGPNIDVCSRGYRCTEGVIAMPYGDPLELNQYKLFDDNVMEFLDITKSVSTGELAQIWEVEFGKRYEVVLTTPDGLWRYQLGDVIEISGFDPTDGVPIIQFIERRNLVLRYSIFAVTEEELGAAILSMAADTSVPIVGWTAAIDQRHIPATIGFFVELLQDDRACDLTLAPQHVSDHLVRSARLAQRTVEQDAFRTPTIRLVPPGTFGEFLQWRLDQSRSHNVAQMKVPAVLSRPEHVAWFSDRTLREL